MKRLVSLFLVSATWSVWAQTPNLFLPAAGSYGTATNWSLGHVPDSNDVAVISVTNSAAATNSSGTFAAGALLMGASTRTGALVVTGGQLAYGAPSTLGTNGATVNLLNSGGALIFSNGLTLAVSTGTATYASLTNHSGTVRVEGNLQLGLHAGAGGGARGLLTVNGGTVTVTGNLATCNAAAYSYIRLNGGVLEVAGVTHAGSATERALFFNGGTLRALRDHAAFLPVAANAVQMTNAVQNGGAILDSQSFAITVATPFVPAAGQTGGLTKVGGGLLDLTANSLYTGATRVAEGTLRISGSGSLYNNGTLAGQLRVEPGAVLALARNDVLGNHASFSPVVIRVLTNAVILNTNTFSTLNNLVLAGGELRALGGANANYGSYQLKGTVTATGDTTSLISAPGTVNALTFIQLGNNNAGGQTTFQVADGAAAVDLQVNAPLVDGRNTAGSATMPSGLIKTGGGRMLLTSNNTFTGTAAVNAGALQLGANATVAGELAVAAGAVLDVSAKPTLTLGAGQVLRGSGLVTGNVAVGTTSAVQGGGFGTPGTLTVGGNLTLDSAYEGVFDLTNSTAVGGGTNDLVVVTGDLDAGLGTIRINPLAPLVSGTYRLMEYTGTEPLPFSGGVVGLNTRDVAVLDETTPGQVNLLVTAGAAQALAWNPAVDGNWDFGTQNWLDAGTRSVTEQFYDLDTVLFDEAGAFNNVVNVTTNLRPAAIFVTGGSNYTFSGNGRLQDQQGGTTVLGKDGVGTLTLANTNSFSGGIVVSNGTLVAGVAGALGGGPVAFTGGGLVLAATQTVTNAVALLAASVAVDDGGNAATLSGLVSGPGQLVKRGGGTLTLAAANSFTGGTVISAGTVRQGVVGALGTAPGPITLGDASSDTNAVAWRFAAGTQPSNAVAVTALGTGPASLGSYNNSTFTEHRGPVSLARAVTLVDGTTDRTSFTGPISGNPGLIVVSGPRITLDNPSNSFVGGLVINGGSIYQNNSTSALPAGTTITNNGSFRLNNGGRHVVDALGGTGLVDIVAGGVATLSLGNGDGSDVFAGRIANGAAVLSLEKRGVGVQTLSNTNSYTGNTTILGGTLALAGLATLAGSPQILVGTAGTLDVSARPGYTLGGNQILYGGGAVTGEVVTAPGAQIRPDGFNSVNTLTFKSGLGLHAGSTNWFDLTATLGVGGGTNDLVVVDGLLEPSNSVIQINPLQPLASGTYTLFTYAGAKTTTFNTNVLGNSTRKTWTLDEATPGLVNLVVAGGYASLVWQPGTSAVWDLAASTNWTDGTNAMAFYNADAVRFDDSGAYSNVVTLSGALQPAAVVVNSSSTYVWQGAGRISGTTMVVKAGSGRLEVRTTNDYTLGTLVSNGTLAVFHNNALGSGVVTIASGAIYSIGTANITNGAILAGAGTIQASTLGTGTASVLLTNAASTFAGTINSGPAAAGGGKLVLDNGVGVAATVNVSNNATLYLRSGSNYTGAIRLEGGDLGETLGQLRLELNTVWSGPVTLAGDIGPAGDGFVGGSTAGGFGFISGTIGETGGPRQLSKVGVGTIRLSGTNLYSGGTRISGGVLDVPTLADAAPSALATNGLLTFAGATLRYSGLADTRTARAITNTGGATWDLTNNVRLTLTGPMSGGGALTKIGVGTWAWSSNTVLLSGGVDINQGTLILDGCTYSNTATGLGDVLGRNAGDFSVVVLTNNPIWSKPSQTLWMSIGANATGVVRMHSGRVTAGAGVRMGNSAGGVGVFYQRGGDILSGSEFDAGYNSAGAYGYYGLTDGTLSNGNWVQAARYGVGVIDVRGGALVATASANGLVAGNNNGTGVYYVVGGTVESAGRLGIGWTGTSRGEFNLAGAALVRIGTAGVMMNQTGSTFSVLNLNAGVLETTNIYRQAAGGYSVVNFAGGTLRARGSAVLMGGGVGGPLQGAYVRAGGAFVDSSNYTVSITQNLLAPTGAGVVSLPWGGPLSGYLGAPYVEISGGGGTGATAVALFDEDSGSVTGLVLTSPGVDYTAEPTVKLLAVGTPDVTLGTAPIGANPAGGLTKLGAGLLALAGTNTYTGATVVAAGTLALNGTHSGGAYTVAAAAVLSGTGVIQSAVAVGGGATLLPGHLGVAGALTAQAVSFAEGAQLSVLAGGTAALVRVTGTDGLTVPAGSGKVQVNVLNTALVAGAYTILDYAGTLQGGAVSNLVLQTYPPRAVMYLTNNTANTSIDLVVVSVASDAIRWLGAVNAFWDINTSSNWMTVAGAQTTAYLQAGAIGDAVVFDDAAVANYSVTLATNVAPASIMASNDLNDYTIAGAFGLGGAGSLVKSGAARLTLATSNSYAGGTMVLGGTLQAGTGGTFCALGTGFITNHGSLVFVHGDAATQSVAIGGTGALTKDGAGTLTLAAFNTYTNLTTVSGGVLRLSANTGSAGTLSGPLAIESGATVVAAVGNSLGYFGTPWVRRITINDGTLATAVAGADNGWGLTITMTGGSITSLVPLGYFSMGATSVVNTAATDHPAWIGANLTVRDTIQFNVARGTAAADLIVNGNLISASALGISKAGTGVLVLSGTNTYSGGTVISGGGVLEVDRIADGVGNLSRIGVAGGSTNFLALQNGTLRWTGTGTNTTTRFLWIDQPQAGSTIEVAQADGTLLLAPAGGNSIYPLTKLGPGTLALAGTAAINAAVTVSNGTLLVNRTLGTGSVTVINGAVLGGTGVVRGAVTQDGIVAPGAGIGTLTISNQVTDGVTAVYRFEVGGTNAPTDYDQLVVSDVHTLQGTLEVVVTNGYVPASGDRFVILTNSGLGGLLFGTFSSVSAPALDPGLGWEVQYVGTESASLVVTGTLAGGLSAYETWAQSIPNPAERGEQADPDGDGYANLLEYSQGTDATNSADNAKLALVRTNGQFLVLFNRVNSATDIVYEVEGAYLPTNNALWLGIATNAIGSWGSSTNVNDNNTAAVHRVLVTDLMIGTNRSLRLKVTRP